MPEYRNSKNFDMIQILKNYIGAGKNLSLQDQIKSNELYEDWN